jgi:hypothetical protein
MAATASNKDRGRHRERSARADALNQLWRAQEKWLWRVIALGVIAAIAAITIPREWQASQVTGLFYVAMMTLYAISTYIWIKRWVAYWRAYHQLRGDTFWDARKADLQAWWISHPWQGRVGVLAIFFVTVTSYLGIHWPNHAIANMVLVFGLAAAVVTSRLTAR